MSILDGSWIQRAAGALFSQQSSNDQARITHALTRRVLSFPVTDGGTAGTSSGEEAPFSNLMGLPAAGGVTGISNAIRVIGAWVAAPIAVAANASNFVTFNVFTRLATGLTQTSLWSFATSGAVSLVAFSPQPLTLVAASPLLQPPASALVGGDVLTISAIKSGTGVAIGSATQRAWIHILIEEE